MGKVENIWGSWGEDIVFQFQTSPEDGSFNITTSYEYTQHRRLLLPPRLEGSQKSLTVIEFTLNIWNIYFQTLEQNTGQKLVASTGVKKVTGNAFGLLGSPKTVATLATDINKYLRQLKIQAESFESYPLIIGDESYGDYVLTDISENLRFFQNGLKKQDVISLTFLEDLEKI